MELMIPEGFNAVAARALSQKRELTKVEVLKTIKDAAENGECSTPFVGRKFPMGLISELMELGFKISERKDHIGLPISIVEW